MSIEVPTTRRATVLLVDDDEDSLATMRDILSDEGHTVLTAQNGRDALSIALQIVPQLVLLDLEMPEMDGRAFLEAVAQAPSLAKMKVVVVSGAPNTADVLCECVAKPLRLDTLLDLIDRAALSAT